MDLVKVGLQIRTQISVHPEHILLTPCPGFLADHCQEYLHPIGGLGLYSARFHFIFCKSHEFLNLVRDEPVPPEEIGKEQNRQKQNSHQISTTEFFQETSTEEGK